MTQYDKPASFPRPYVPTGEGPLIPDPFGNLLRTAPEIELGTPGPAGPPGTGGGGGIPDVDVRDGVTGAVLHSGTETFAIPGFGNSVYWVKFSVNNNGAAGFCYFLGTLAF
jgi:hypothetical protein